MVNAAAADVDADDDADAAADDAADDDDDDDADDDADADAADDDDDVDADDDAADDDDDVDDAAKFFVRNLLPIRTRVSCTARDNKSMSLNERQPSNIIAILPPPRSHEPGPWNKKCLDSIATNPPQLSSNKILVCCLLGSPQIKEQVAP